jgi:hypothetical protein
LDYKDFGLLLKSKKFLLKLHGTWDKIDSIVLTESQYGQLSVNQAYKTFYQSIQFPYSLLFLGYGGRDPDLEQMHTFMHQLFEGRVPERYLLLSNPKPGQKDALEKNGWHVAEYDSEHDGHDVITHLLIFLGTAHNNLFPVESVVPSHQDVSGAYRAFLQ